MIEILKKCGIDIDELSEEDQLIVTNALITAWKKRLAKRDPDEVRESMIAALRKAEKEHGRTMLDVMVEIAQAADRADALDAMDTIREYTYGRPPNIADS